MRAAARRRVHDRRLGSMPLPAHWSISSRERRRVAGRADRGRPADRDRERSRAVVLQLLRQRLACDLQLAPRALTGAGEVQLRAEQRRQQLVADRNVGPIARQHEVHLQPEHGTGRRRHPAVVRLSGADRHERARSGGLRRAAQVLQLARLVAAHAEPGEVVALDPQPHATGQQRPTLERRRQRRQPGPRQLIEHGGMLRRSASSGPARHDGSRFASMATTDWNPILRGEFDKPYWRDLQQFVDRRAPAPHGVPAASRRVRRAPSHARTPTRGC